MRTTLFVVLAIASLSALAGCGKRQPPRPPAEKVRQQVELKASQQGNKILLVWKLPAVNASTSSLNNIDRADIYRLASAAGTDEALSEEDFAAASTLISSVKLSKADFGKDFSHVDTLGIAGQPVTLRYAIRLVNNSGQKAAFSNFAVIEPATKVANAPEDISATIGQDAVTISWKTPPANIDGTSPANVIGFNVYRTGGTTKVAKLLNRTPVTSGSFGDADFEFGNTYSYFLRTVSLGSNGDPIESLDSSEITVSPRDVFAPAAPEAITIAAAPRAISIFFANNLEKDVAGYRVYRATDPGTAINEWTLMTEKLLKVNTFQDDSVESGKTYYYFIIAVDKAGNASERSITVSETVPQ